MDIEIESLHNHHDRDMFDCGVHELNVFLKKYANQNQKNHISKTFIAVDAATKNSAHKKEILGFYSIATGQINFDQLPPAMKHPKYPVSIARLARLAVDLKHQGKGVGGFLLGDALEKIRVASQMVGIFAIVVDAKDDKAKSFYQSYGFIALEDTALTLFLPMEMLERVTDSSL